MHLAFCRTPGVHSHFWQAPWFALWTCTPAPTTLSTELLATPTLDLCFASSTSRSRPRWQCVEQVPCVLWARPERTFCTRAHYTDTPHCRTRRDPTLAPSASLSRALAAPAPRSLWRPAAPLAAPLAARRRRQRIPPRTALPKPPAHDSCPGAQAVLILPLVGTRSSPPRCPATTGKRSPAILSAATAEPASSRYIKGPRAPPSTHATSDFPRRASRVVNRAVVAVSLNSGQLGRR